MAKKNKPSSIKDILDNMSISKIKAKMKADVEKSYDIRTIFEQMELDLISSMHKAFYYHKREEAKEGFQFEQWQLTKLRELEKYKKRNTDIIGAYMPVIQETIDRELINSYTQGENNVERLIDKAKNDIKEFNIEFPDDISEKQATKDYILGETSTPPADNNFFGVNEKKLKALTNSVKNDLNKSKYSILRKMDDVYRQTIFKSQVYMQSGTKTLYQAIDMTTKDFLKQGINSITYSNGKRVNISSYAEMCLRTASHRAMLLGEGTKRDEYAIHLVVVSAHANTCPMCEPWQGKILVDDIFSHPSAEYIDKHKQYKKVSEAIDKSLLHPNCRHALITYFEGVTKIPVIPDGEKAIETYKAEQKQRAYERNIRRWKRIAEGSVDDNNKLDAINKVKLYQTQLRKLLEEHTELRRNYNREE